MRARAALAALLPMALLAPAAGAQLGVVAPTLNVFVEDPGRAFLPGGTENVSVVVNYAPGQGGRPTPAPTPDRPENTTPTRVTLATKQVPTWITNVTFDPPELFFDLGVENVGASTYSSRATATLHVAPDAPALQRESFIVTATADPNGNMQGATRDSPDLKLRATTVGLLNVTAPEPRTVIPGGRWITLPFTIRNDGNSDIVARINVTVRPENSQVRFDETLQLERGQTTTIDVQMRTPWTNAEFGELELEAVPIVDGEEGSSARASIDIHGESAVPATPLGAWLAGAAALAARRRRNA